MLFSHPVLTQQNVISYNHNDAISLAPRVNFVSLDQDEDIDLDESNETAPICSMCNAPFLLQCQLDKHVEEHHDINTPRKRTRQQMDNDNGSDHQTTLSPTPQDTSSITSSHHTRSRKRPLCDSSDDENSNDYNCSPKKFTLYFLISLYLQNE